MEFIQIGVYLDFGTTRGRHRPVGERVRERIADDFVPDDLSRPQARYQRFLQGG